MTVNTVPTYRTHYRARTILRADEQGGDFEPTSWRAVERGGLQGGPQDVNNDLFIVRHLFNPLAEVFFVRHPSSPVPAFEQRMREESPAPQSSKTILNGWKDGMPSIGR